MSPLYIQFHIPRTGGTTLLWKLGNPFDREDNRWLRHYTWTYQQDYQYHNVPLLERRTTEQQEQLKFITGQGTFDQCHRWLNVKREPHYFSFIRNPIDRVLSSFNYRNGMTILNQDPSPFTMGGPAMNMDARLNQRTAKDYDTLYNWYQHAFGEHNLQCKWLLKSFNAFMDGSIIPYSDLIKDKTYPEPGIWSWWFAEIEIDDELFEIVLDIVDNKMWWIGTNDTLREDIIALCNYTDMPYVNTQDRHISGEDYPVYWTKQQVEQQVDYNKIVEAEKYDNMLYEYVKEKARRPF